jgi:hypothetical protein
MSKVTWLLRSLTVYSVMGCVMFGTAIGVTNVLVNNIHWLGAYLIACPTHHWAEQPILPLPPAKDKADRNSSDQRPTRTSTVSSTNVASTAQ